MPFTALGKNLMLDAHKGTNPAAPTTHTGLFQENAALTGLTSVAATDLITKASHGLSAGDMGVFRTLTGGAGLRAELPFFVIASGITANDFKVSLTPGGASFDHTTNLTAGSFVKLVEISGGSPAYARKAIAFAAAVDGLQDDSTNGAVVDVPACTVNYVGFFSAVSAGNLNAVKQVTTEIFAAQGTYTVTDAKLDLNNDVLP